MKKKLLLFPIIGLLLSGCWFEDIMFWKKKDSDNQQNDDSKPSDQGQDPTNTDPVPVSKIILSEHNIEIEELEQRTLTFTVEPANATYKTIEWSVGSGLIASVVDGVVNGINQGTTSVTVTVDNAKSDTCSVTVNKKVPQVHTVTSSIVFNDLGLTERENSFTYVLNVDDDTTLQFFRGTATFDPRCYDGSVGKGEYEARVYPGHTFTITNETTPILKVEIIFSTEGDGTNPITADVGTFTTDTWTGSSNVINFSVGGNASTDGHRRISAIKVTYEGEHDQDEPINLGVKTISEVREYIASHEVKKNKYGVGVNELRTVTIVGFALAKINLEKTTSKYGLDVSKPGKVIMADSTGYIGCASTPSGEGTTLFGKVGEYVCESTAKYIVTGYISEYLGHPEIMVTSFTWDKTLDISWDINVVTDATVEINEFYERAANTSYNCAGHAYGEILSLKKLKLYYTESDGEGVRYYNFTDGTRNIRVNAFNLGSISEGKNYDITGIMSIKNLSPIIVAFEIKASSDQTVIDFSYESAATSISVEDLKKIHGSQDDADPTTVANRTKWGETIQAFGNVYKTNGYLCVVEENGKLYVGISDTYYANNQSGKDNTCASKNVALIDNNNFWNVTEEQLARYNPYYNDYIQENVKVDVYFVPRLLRYQSDKAIWKVLLIPESIPSLSA